MIGFSDVASLVSAKLRSHKIRTVITIFISSLLFALLIMASLVVNGAFKSANEFSKSGLSSRYIVSVSNPTSANMTAVLTGKDLIANAKKKYTDLTKEKVAQAKRLNIQYDPSADQPPYFTGIDGVERLVLSDKNGIVRSLLEDKYGDKEAFDVTRLRKDLKPYDVKDILGVSNYMLKQGSTLQTFENGKEVFYDATNQEEANRNYRKPLIDSTYSVVPDTLMKDFMFENNGGWTAQSDSVPIVLPQNIVEQLLSMNKLSSSASTSERLNRMKELREKAPSFKVQACYRNEASQSLIQQTIQQMNEAQLRKSDKSYVAPSLQYSLPDPTQCANPSVTKDTRSTLEKKEAFNQDAFDSKFGLSSNRQSYFVSFSIVGISPPVSDSPDQSQSGIDVIGRLLQTTGFGQSIPESLYQQIKSKDKFKDILAYEPNYLFGPETNTYYYVEFGSSISAQKFISEKSCDIQNDGTCKPAGRDYTSLLVFSNSVAIDDIRSTFNKWFLIALGSIAAIASIISLVTMSRTISDSRKETAVYRAIGFKRIDIFSINIMYIVALSLITTFVAMLIGIIAANIINNIYSPSLTSQAQYLYGGTQNNLEFTLLHADTVQMLLIVGTCFVIGIVSAIVPLLFSLKRNPIKDMKDA